LEVSDREEPFAAVIRCTADPAIRAKPAVVNVDPRSPTKTKGDGWLSRWSRRRHAGPGVHRHAKGACAILDPPDVQHRGIKVHLAMSASRLRQLDASQDMRRQPLQQT
jgi:hypothetical protein